MFQSFLSTLDSLLAHSNTSIFLITATPKTMNAWVLTQSVFMAFVFRDGPMKSETAA